MGGQGKMLQPEGKQQRSATEHRSGQRGKVSPPSQTSHTARGLHRHFFQLRRSPAQHPSTPRDTNPSLSYNRLLWCMNGDLETLQRAWMRFASPPCPIQCCLEALKTHTCRVLAWKPQLLHFPALAALTSPSPWCTPEAHTSLEITLGLCFPSSRD